MKQQARKSDRNFKGNEQKTILILLTVVASIAILYIQNIAVVLILAYLWYLEVLEIRKYNRRKEIERLVEI